MLRSKFLLAPLLGFALVTSGVGSAGAAVVPSATAAVAQGATLTPQTVDFRGHDRVFIPHGGYHHGFHRWGTGAFIGGLGAGLVAGALASPYGYGYGPGSGPYYDYYPGDTESYDYAPPVQAVPGNSVGWCEQHYKSYNPATGSYLGYDGLHHACP
jgi:hypothetical protein